MRGFGTLALIRSGTALSLGLLRNPSLRVATTRSDSLLSSIFRQVTPPAVVLHAMESKGKHSATGRSSSSSDTLDTPEWFKPERVRCLTEVTTPLNRGKPRIALYSCPRREPEGMQVLGFRDPESTAKNHHSDSSKCSPLSKCCCLCFGNIQGTINFQCCHWVLFSFFMPPPHYGNHRHT